MEKFCEYFILVKICFYNHKVFFLEMTGHAIFIQYVTPDITAWMTKCAFAMPAP